MVNIARRRRSSRNIERNNIQTDDRYSDR